MRPKEEYAVREKSMIRATFVLTKPAAKIIIKKLKAIHKRI